jgi:hypothetical protein
MSKIFYILTTLALLFSSILMPLAANAQAATQAPASAQPYQFQSDGIAGCNRTSAAASSVGAFTASGSYVPVSDAAVELNTGYLVYLACSLNPLVSALSQSATAGLVKKITTTYTSGNNGGPQFSVNIDTENLNVANNTVLAIVPDMMSAVNSALKSRVQNSVVQTYYSATQQPYKVLNCPYAGDLNALLNGSTFSWAGLQALQNPACNPLGAYQLSNDLLNTYVANSVQNNMTQLQWGRGTYPVMDSNGNVVTPGAIVLSQVTQAIESGFQKTQSAVAIGQMVSALFAGIGAQAVSSAQGLAGITQSSGSNLSYIDQVAAVASRGVNGAIINAAITTLNGVLTSVTNYVNALNTIAQTYIQTIHSLQGTESQCWIGIVQNVCTAGTLQVNNGVTTCTQVPGKPTTTTTTTTGGQGGQGGQGGNITTTTTTPAPTVILKIATSSAFSNAVIQAGSSPTIASQSQSIAAQIHSAQGSLAAVNQLIAGVTNTSSADAQSLALSQLDSLVHTNGFPSPESMNSVGQQSTSITSAMQQLVTTTVQNWEGLDNNTGAQDISWDGTVSANTVGWCNYNDPKTLAEWEAVWKQ